MIGHDCIRYVGAVSLCNTLPGRAAPLLFLSPAWLDHGFRLL